MSFFRTFLTSVLFCAFPVVVSAQWIKQNINTTASFRGLSVVNEKVVWASGTGGIVIRTIDGGKTWDVMTVPGAEKLDFRDIEAFDTNTAYILSIGNGESSRIYKTVNGGKNWLLQFKNTNEKAFYDAIACSDKSNCIAISDSIDGRFPFVFTGNGGQTWEARAMQGHRREDLVTARDGEAAFAASGTCLIATPKRSIYFVTGGSATRVYRTYHDYFPQMWFVEDTPIIKGSSGSGIFSIAMLDEKNGVIIGGNYEKPNEANDNLALTNDGGVTWTLGSGLSGYRSSVTYVDKNTIIAVGTNGTDLSRDGGKTWKKIGDENLNAVQTKGNRAVWAAGPKGLVVRLK